MGNLPWYIGIVFITTSIFTVLLFYKASNKSISVLLFLFGWLALQAFLALNSFYLETDTFPPRFILLALPSLLFILVLFVTKEGKLFLDKLNVKTLTILHIVRIPVELVLYWLFVYKSVPLLMTFEGRNFDILSGLSAPFIYYFGFVKNKLSQKTILIWNLICLGLLLNIVINAILSAPTPIQKFAFDQPNIAVLYFPYTWLPSCIVPLVLLSHLACIRKQIQINKLVS